MPETRDVRTIPTRPLLEFERGSLAVARTLGYQRSVNQLSPNERLSINWNKCLRIRDLRGQAVD